MVDQVFLYLDKAIESLAGAESEYANGRYDNCANRCYYACFQAAIAALLHAGTRPRGGQWGHGYVQAAFVRDLISRSKEYPSELRDTLMRTYAVRRGADYLPQAVTQREAFHALRRARTMVQMIQAKVGENDEP